MEESIMNAVKEFNRPQMSVLFAMMAANAGGANVAPEFHLDLVDYMEALKLANDLASKAHTPEVKRDAQKARDYIIKNFIIFIEED